MDQYENKSYFGNEPSYNPVQNNQPTENAPQRDNQYNQQIPQNEGSSYRYGVQREWNNDVIYNGQNERRMGYGPQGFSNGQYNAPYSSSMSYSQASNAAKEKKKNGASTGFVVFMFIFAIILSLLIGSLASFFIASSMKETSKPSGSVVITHKNADGNTEKILNKGTPAYAASIAKGSVVEINTEQITYNAFLGQMISSGAGSGVIISSTEDGTYIITCAHVIAEAKTVSVILSDGTRYEASYTAYDEISDIGLIKIDVSGLPCATVGDSADLVPAENIIVIGNPLGQLGGSVSSGVISALERQINIEGINYSLIQTDASINKGNSGGGMFDMDGNLVGIVNAKSAAETVEGLGFAIPISKAMEIFDELLKNGYVSGRAALGVSIIDIQSTNDIYDYPQYYKYFTDFGVYIVNSVNGDFDEGDRIVSINNVEITCYNDLRNYLLDCSVGDEVEVQISRLVSSGRRTQTQLLTVKVTLIEKVTETVEE